MPRAKYKSPVDMREAGHKLAVLRESLDGMTQEEMQRATGRLEEQGRGKQVWAQQISRIEEGQVLKPPILDLLSIAQVLHMSTAQILDLYGLWFEAEKPEEGLHPTLVEAQKVLSKLDSFEAEQFLTWVTVAISQGKALLARRNEVVHRGGGVAPKKSRAETHV